MSAAAHANVGGADWRNAEALREASARTAAAALLLLESGRDAEARVAARYARELAARARRLERRARGTHLATCVPRNTLTSRPV